MNFISAQFVLLFPILLVMYWRIPGRLRWSLLLVTSCIFCLFWTPWTLLLLGTTTVVSYLTAIAIENTSHQKMRKFWLILTLILCLGCLILFKYLGFLTANVAWLAAVLKLSVHIPQITVFLPVGISFYTFHTLSYVIDVYRGDFKAERHLGYYSLFVIFFPQLVAGPIARPGRLLPQFHQIHDVRREDLMAGFQLLLRGFYKKLVIADFFAVYVDRVYGDPSNAGGPAILVATVFFSFQIYCDFSGYSDIALGSARMLGIYLMENFDSPYLTGSIQDFWRKWHISLTSWFMDYIYIPMGGSRKGLLRHIRNILLVFLISGAWHGASWTYILWGGLHGMYLTGGVLWKRWFHDSSRFSDIGVCRLLRQLRTFALVTFAWIFFRANSMTDLGILLNHLITGWKVTGLTDMGQLFAMNLESVWRGGLALVVLYQLRQLPDRRNGASSVFYLVTLILLAWLTAMGTGAASSFIYFQF